MALKIGDKIPCFFNEDNNTVFNWDKYKGKPLVIYFYPKDDTPGCTTQACGFRDEYETFKELGAEVIGISGDSNESHEKFAQKYKLPFLLLSDNDKKIRKLFGVPSNLFGLIPGRVTYVMDKNGIIQFIFNSMSAKNHVQKAKEIIQKMTE